MQIRKGDKVYIRTGSSRGKTGRVLVVDYKKDKILVEGINMQKKHERPSQKNQKGGIVTLEAPIHLSNVALYSNTLKGPTKIGRKVINDSGKKKSIRICRKTGEEI